MKKYELTRAEIDELCELIFMAGYKFTTKSKPSKWRQIDEIVDKTLWSKEELPAPVEEVEEIKELMQPEFYNEKDEVVRNKVNELVRTVNKLQKGV